MINNVLMKSLPMVAAALGSKLGVRVEVGGTTASTDGKTIHLPMLIDSPVSENALHGFLAHECGHVRFSNFRLLTVKKPAPAVKTFFNIFEDGRIEEAMKGIFPGASWFLEELCSYLVSSKTDFYGSKMPIEPNGQVDPLAVLSGWLFCLIRENVNGITVFPVKASDYEPLCRVIFGDKACGRIKAVALATKRAESSEDCLRAAEEVAKVLKSVAEGKPQTAPGDEASDGQSDGQSAGSGGKSEGEPSDSDSGSSDGSSGKSEKDAGKDAEVKTESESAGGKPSGEETEDDGKEAGESEGDSGKKSGKTQKRSSKSGKGKESKDSEVPTAKQSAAAKSALDASEDEAEEVAKAVDTTAQVKGEIEKEARANPPQSWSWGQKAALGCNPSIEAKRTVTGKPTPTVVENARRSALPIRRQMMRLIESCSQRDSWLADSGRRLHLPSLSRVACGNTRVFLRRDERRSPNTAFHVLLDMSGSMTNSRETALEAALTLYLALEPVRSVYPALSAFPANAGYGSGARLSAFRPGVRPTAELLERYSGIAANGGTPLLEALLETSADIQSFTKAERHVIIVITDGGVDDKLLIGNLLAKMKQSGIETMCIAINQPVPELFDNEESIRSCDELAGALTKLASRSVYRHIG